MDTPAASQHKTSSKLNNPALPEDKRRSKWTLGSLFRRRKQTKNGHTSDSSSEVEEKPRNFLRKHKKTKEIARKEITKAQPWSGSANSLGSSEGFGSHSSLTRKDRRELLKARVEATRRNSSSEDEFGRKDKSSSRSNLTNYSPNITNYSPNLANYSPNLSNLARFKSDESLMNKKTRAARTERYLKRISRDEDSISHLSKSDVEVHQPPNWAATVVYRETPPYVIRPVSASPSPIVSPRTKRRVFQSSPHSDIPHYSSQIPQYSTQYSSQLPQYSPQLPRVRRSYCEPARTEVLPTFRSSEVLPNYRSSSTINMASNTNGLPSTPLFYYSPVKAPLIKSQPPPPPPRDPQRKLLLYNGTQEALRSEFRTDQPRSGTEFRKDQPRSGADFRTEVPRSGTDFRTEVPRSGTEFRTEVPRDNFLSKQITPEPVPICKTQFQYLADKTPRSRRPIHVVPLQEANNNNVVPTQEANNNKVVPVQKTKSNVHEASPEITMPSPPSWLNNPITEKTQNKVEKTQLRPDSIERVQIRQQSKTPPPPPVRRYSRQSSVSSMDEEPKRQSNDESKRQSNEEPRRQSKNNLEDALNELEEIYKSLRLGDEDLLDRAERRDLPTAHQNINLEPLGSDVVLRRTTRAPPNRRSGIPDLVMDDMAYRRLNTTAPPVNKDQQTGSYLLVSPTLSPPDPSLSQYDLSLSGSQYSGSQYDPDEPDITLDDMSYRALRTASKVIEPPPPFGIPVIPAPAAPDSDYLHAKPTEKFRPTLRPRKTPDVVQDDLAFRNLRKDSENVKKKRAVRSLSANLMSIMDLQNMEKTQSMSNVPQSLRILLENAENTPNRPPPSWVERANLIDKNMSTETLTQSRANLRSLRNSFLTDSNSRPTSILTESSRPNSLLTENSRPNSLLIGENSRPNSLYQRHVTPIKEDDFSPSVCPLEDEKLEELLSALAKEAHETSERLGQELERLRDGSQSIEDLSKVCESGSAGDVWRSAPNSAFKIPPGRVVITKPVFSSDVISKTSVFPSDVTKRDLEMTSNLRTSERARLRAASAGVEGSEESRSDRIARYKDERRKQLAVQYGNTSSSSGVESPIGDYRRHAKGDGFVSEPLRNIRTTRASRLRALAATGAPSPPPGNSEIKTEVRVKRKSKVDSPDASSSSAPSSEVTSREGTPQCASAVILRQNLTSRSERDKSSKRKSNLNRSLTEEPLPATPSSDSTTAEEAPRRRKPIAPVTRTSSMGAGVGSSCTLRGRSPSTPTPPVFQRLLCNVRPARRTPEPTSRRTPEPALRRTPEPSSRRTPEPNHEPKTKEIEVSKKVDSLMARTKEFEARMDRLASKKTVNLASRASPPKLVTRTKSKPVLVENEKNLVVKHDILNEQPKIVSEQPKIISEQPIIISEKPELFIDEGKLVRVLSPIRSPTRKVSSPSLLNKKTTNLQTSVRAKSPIKSPTKTPILKTLSRTEIMKSPEKIQDISAGKIGEKVVKTDEEIENAAKSIDYVAKSSEISAKSTEISGKNTESSDKIVKTEIKSKESPSKSPETSSNIAECIAANFEEIAAKIVESENDESATKTNQLSIDEEFLQIAQNSSYNYETHNLDDLIAALAETGQCAKTEVKSAPTSPVKSPVLEPKRKSSILKKKSVDESNTPVSILKHKDEAGNLNSNSCERGILKKRASLEDNLDERRSASREDLEERPFSPASILKLRVKSNSVGETARPILKKKSSDDLSDDSRPVFKENEPRPILKKRASTDEEMDDKLRPILKSGRKSVEGDDGSNYSSAAGSPVRRSPLEDGVVRNQVALTLRFIDPDTNLRFTDPDTNEGAEGELEERRPSVSERAQLFMRLTELNSAQPTRPRDPAIRRERAKRFSTQPVTSEEVDEARGQLQQSTSQQQQQDSPSEQPGSLLALPTDEDDEPSQLSLAERVRLFNQKIIEQATPPPTMVTQKRTLRRKVTSTRFRTLPVTEAEVEQVISPLAASFVKPPDPNVLGGMSARAAREAMFEHASKALSPKSQQESPELESGDSRPRGILKHPEEEDEDEETEIVRGILKIPASAIQQARLLAAQQQNNSSASVKSALKKESSFDDPSPRVGILKESSIDFSSGSSSEEEVQSSSDLASILNTVASNATCLQNVAENHTNYAVTEHQTKFEVTENFSSQNTIVSASICEEHDFSVPQIDFSVPQNLNKCDIVASSSDECDTSSSGGREVKTIIGLVDQRLVTSKQQCIKDNNAGSDELNNTTPDRLSPVVTDSEFKTPNGDEITPAHQSDTSDSDGDVNVVLLDVPVKNKSPVKSKSSVLDRLSPELQNNLPPGPHRSKTSSDVPSAKSVSIAQRLAALKHSGETEWRKRVPKPTPELEISTNGGTNGTSKEVGLKPLQTSASLPGCPGGILAEKLGQLDKAAQNWKARVGPNQALEFSVAGRMGVPSTPPPSSPLNLPSDRKKKTPKPARFKSKIAGKGEARSTPNSPHKDLIALTRSISAPDGNKGEMVEVPSPHDETFAAFFSSRLDISPDISPDKVDTKVEVCDFEQLEIQQHTLLIEHKRTVKMSRRRLASRNPVKALAARTDLLQEYQEVRTGAAEREVKRLNVEKLAKHSNLAVEALAGLASKEDFTAINLKKATNPPAATLLLPYQELMLLRVKGRRHVQTRLVEPLASCVNSGDSYILVTPNAVYNFLGRLSNVIERTRSAELALQISQQKDLGCGKAGGSVLTIDESKGPGLHRRAFWRLLGVEDGNGEPGIAGHPDEDEMYEASVTDTNMVYTVDGDELVPLEKFWGGLPRIEMLDHSKVLVFDFGAELYVWSGKNAGNDTRKAGVSLARELWEAKVDYSECDISPIDGGTVQGERPSWCLMAKISQHMETALFREKFADWPEFSRVIRVKGQDDEEKQVDGSIEVLPLDMAPILSADWSEPDLELEGSHLGRGHQYFDAETHRQFCVSTSAVTVWHVEEFSCDEIAPESLGHFHADDSFVVRWNYSITVTGRELSGAPSKHAMVGRARCAYFFWQGGRASVSEQGAAALLTVELDREQGPHVRVEQGNEPAAFLRLFQGQMVIHQGHREPQEEQDELPSCRLYLVRCGSSSEECSLLQVSCSVRQLRSRTSLILLNRKTGGATVWHGAQSHQTTRKAALAAANRIAELKPAEFDLEVAEIKITEVVEGKETPLFFTELGGGRRQLYVSLPTCTVLPPVRMFHLSSASGSFVATEMLSPARCQDPPQAFPFQQKELYTASQPALFLVDCGPQLWLWQGWWAEEGGEEAAGSGAVRWQAERRAAMQTALDYWKLANKSGEIKAGLVWAGLEPLAFTNLFPEWSERDDAAECNIQDGRKAGEELSVNVELARLTRSTYPPAELLLRPLPEGVDPTRLEDYLAPEHFEEVFGLTKEEFYELPSWKQTNVKKEIGLF